MPLMAVRVRGLQSVHGNRSYLVKVKQATAAAAAGASGRAGSEW